MGTRTVCVRTLIPVRLINNKVVFKNIEPQKTQKDTKEFHKRILLRTVRCVRAIKEFLYIFNWIYRVVGANVLLGAAHQSICRR
jgi:hypothetical protein